MRILLLGDFSSSHYNLKLGLQELGHEVTLVSKGDGFKQTPSDIKLYTRTKDTNKYVGAIREMVDQYSLSRVLRGYDVVQTASHVFYHNRLDKYLFPKIFEYNEKTVLFHAACSVPLNKFFRKLEYSPCITCKKHDLVNNICEHEKPEALDLEYSRYSKYNAIVSSHYEYYKSMEDSPFKDKNVFIPIPVRTSELQVPISKVPDKINVYYGEIRRGFKGGDIIEQAIEKVKSSEYGKYFHFTISQHLPYNDYVRVMNEAHVLIDQVNSYSYGVNALVGLSKGKIVLSGAEPEALQFMGVHPDECPLLNIRPSVDDVYNKLVSIYEQRHSIVENSHRSIEFVKKHHDPIMIAGKYVDLYRCI